MDSSRLPTPISEIFTAKDAKVAKEIEPLADVPITAITRSPDHPIGTPGGPFITIRPHSSPGDIPMCLHFWVATPDYRHQTTVIPKKILSSQRSQDLKDLAANIPWDIPDRSPAISGEIETFSQSSQYVGMNTDISALIPTSCVHYLLKSRMPQTETPAAATLKTL